MHRVPSDSHAPLFLFVVNEQALLQSYETFLQIYRQLPSRIDDQDKLIEREIQSRTKVQELSDALAILPKALLSPDVL